MHFYNYDIAVSAKYINTVEYILKNTFNYFIMTSVLCSTIKVEIFLRKMNDILRQIQTNKTDMNIPDSHTRCMWIPVNGNLND